MLIDTHAHLYVKQFEKDRAATIERAISEGVERFILPNIDEDSIEPMWELVRMFPKNCFPSIAIHPCDVAEDYERQLGLVEHELATRKYIAVGETGIDMYWDKTSLQRQIKAFEWHVEKAKALDLPIIIHARESFDEIFKVLDEHQDGRLRGVLHCFTGNLEQAKRVVGFGLKLGIGGVLTFKKSGLDEVVKDIDLQYLLLETDAPYLAPVPFRGKRNESSYVVHIAKKIAEVKSISYEEVVQTTTQSAVGLFGKSIL